MKSKVIVTGMTKKTIKKKIEKKPGKPKEEAVKKPQAQKYFFGLGRRKTARAKVKLFPEGKGEIVFNQKPIFEYFPTLQLQKVVLDPLSVLGFEKKFDVAGRLSGGGISAQARAASLGIARALVLLNPDHKTVLKKQGFLTRDSRKKERKKPGLKRARRAPQWQKR